MTSEFVVAPAGLALRLSLAEVLDAGHQRIFVAAGGAGLRHALNAISRRDAEAIVLPVDGAEEFVRWIGIPSDFLSAAAQSWAWSARPVDLLSVRLSSGARELTWGMAQAGPAVEAGWLSAGHPTISMLVAMLSSGRFTVPSFELDTGEERIAGRLLHVGVAGPAVSLFRDSAGAALADSSSPIQAVLAGLLPASQLFHAISAMLDGGGFKWPLERRISAKRLRLMTDPPIPCYIDSEAVGYTPLEIEMAPAAVRLLLPTPAHSVAECKGGRGSP